MVIDSAVFYTDDIEQVVAFYLDKLGFRLEFREGDRYVSFIFESGVRLGIKLATQEREIPGAQTVCMAVESISQMYDLCQEKGIVFHKPISNEPGFGDNFAIYDPDHNKIEFVQRLAAPKA